MAFYNSEDEEDDNAQGMNGEDEQSQPDQPVELSNQTSNIGAGPNAPKAPKVASSGSGPSFNSYAKANQGKAQDSLNSAVAQNVANSGQTATNAINQATDTFGRKVDSGSLANRENAVQDVQGTVNSARNITTGAAVDQGQQDRFKEVINAKYQGPESLRQAGLYQLASGKVGTAQNKLDNTKTATGRGDLLQSMYAPRGDYTSGLGKLDSALLNASQQGVSQLQNVADAQGNLGQNLDKAQVNSANLAQNRAGEIKNIQEQARTTFDTGKNAEEAATEERLASVIKDWDKLPEYFRDIIRGKKGDNKEILANSINQFKTDSNYGAATQAYSAAQKQLSSAKNALASLQNTPGATPEQILQAQQQISAYQSSFNLANKQKNSLDKKIQGISAKFNPNATILNPFEAEVLGVDSGEGLYKLGANAIKTAQAEKARLISQDEQARQAALASLAGLDLSNRLDTNLLYDKADLAGTQSALDALDLEGTRAGLNAAEQNFEDTAEGTKLTGIGRKKVSRGNAFGKKTKTYSASVGGKAGDFLEKAGYDFDSADENADTQTSQALLKAALAASSSQNAEEGNSFGEAMNSAALAASGFGAVDAAQSALEGVGLGGVSDIVQGARNTAGDVSEGVLNYNPYNIAAKSLGLGNIAGNIGSAVRGIDSGAMKAYGSAIAKKHAVTDLQNKYKKFLSSQGFDNRIAVADNDTVTSRLGALQSLLANMDKTNT